MTGIQKLDQVFTELKDNREGALGAFVTAGDPSLEVLPEVIATLESAGADIIEIGIPFSDPIADGPAIQASSFRALQNGTTPRAVLEKLSQIRTRVPVLLMGYWNTILHAGPEAFAEMAVQSGVCGTIVCDTIPEEMDDWIEVSKAFGLANVLLCAPNSGQERVSLAARTSTGFVYAVSRTGVTGASKQVPAEAEDLVARVRSCTSTPVCVGFGISEPEHVAHVCRYADGAIVGSKLVNLLHRLADDDSWKSALYDTVKELKQSTIGN